MNILTAISRLTAVVLFMLTQGVQYGTPALSVNGPSRILPDGLSLVDWQDIHAEYERRRHAFFPVGGEHHARNFRQQWLARFDGRGFTIEPDSGEWSWGLELKRYGHEGELRSVPDSPRVRSQTNCLTYSWDDTIDEWYINQPDSLEHGFTVHRKPSGSGRLVVELELRGSLTSRADGANVMFGNSVGIERVRYSNLEVRDATGRVLPSEFLTDRLLTISIDTHGARYPITIDPLVQQAYLKASNRAVRFGTSVAIYGETVVVGAPEEPSNATGVNGNQSSIAAPGSGAVYVFVRTAGTWRQQAYLKASNTGVDDNFGNAVAISGDTVVVGAWFEASGARGVGGNQQDNSMHWAGAAYVFVRSAGTWSQQAYVKSSNTDPLDLFGASVSIDQDTMAVSAPHEASRSTGVNGIQQDNGLPASGAVYVFQRQGTLWTQQAYLKASNAGQRDQFGLSLTINRQTLAVGAPGEGSHICSIGGIGSSNNAPHSGAIYVFERSGSGWRQQAYLKASNCEADDRFGSSVSVEDNTLVAGAWGESSSARGVNGDQSHNGSSRAGAAYVFTRNGESWSQQAYLKASNTGPDDMFGSSVALSAERILVGAPQESSSATGIDGDQSSNSAPRAGAAYLFVRSSGIWSQVAYVKPSNTGRGDEFGCSTCLAVSARYLVIGARTEASSTTGIDSQPNDDILGLGAAYIFGDPVGLRFVPLSPCRLVDTRTAYAGPRVGPFGPPFLNAGSERTIPLLQSTTCTIPASAKAYALNLTLDTVENQTGPVDSVTIWPTGEPAPAFHTARTSTGGYIANATIVKAGSNGAISIRASHAVNVILDITGFFTDDAAFPGLLYYPISPCRAVDTRGPVYSALPPPYGNQRMRARENRSFRLPGSPACQIPSASAYSVQLTLAPGELTNGSSVAFITAYPSGLPQPNISTMNALQGYAVANSAIVPASTNGSIDVFAFDATNLIIDVNGYFAPDDGTGRGLMFFPVAQCRLMNTQDPALIGSFGGPAMLANVDRTIAVAGSRCSGLPQNARAWALNASVVPSTSSMPFLSLWPSGTPWPNISQLNAFQGKTVANFGIVPASETGAVDIRVAGPTHVTLEVGGYFAR